MSEQVLESLSDMCHLDLALEVSSDMWHTHMMHARYLHTIASMRTSSMQVLEGTVTSVTQACMEVF